MASASAADSGVETGNDSNDSTIIFEDKLFKMDLENSKQQIAQEKETIIFEDKLFKMGLENSTQKIAQEKGTSSAAGKSHEDLIRPHSSSDLYLMENSLSHLHPTTLMHGYEYRPKHPSIEPCFTLNLRPNRDIGGVFVSGGPLGTQYKGSDLIHKLRYACRYRQTMRRFRSFRCSSPSVFCQNKDAVRMCRAACQNNTEAMREMLDSGMSPNVPDGYKRTPLHLAACMGYADMVKLLLDHGADPNAKDTIGNTPLHLAACTNHVPVITLLLKAGTQISATNSPLQLAITKFNIIKRSVMPHPVLKEQVAQVISMLSEYMRRKEAPSLDAELLNKFESLVRVSDSSEQVENGIRDLLSNLSSLDISSPS